MHQIAVIGLSSLEAMAMGGIVSSIGDAEAETFIDFELFLQRSEKFSLYVVTSDIFSMNIDFFLMRKGRFLILTDGHSVSETSVGREADVSTIGEALRSLVARQEPSRDSGALSNREIEVLKALVSGKTVKEIGDELCISPNTVITHRKNISVKLGIKSISGLSVYALMNGLI